MAGSTTSSARAYVEQMKCLLDGINCRSIETYVDLLFDVWTHDRAVWVFGNGGSASCASHHVADYVKTAEVSGRRRLRAFSLCDNKEMLTAIGNDVGYDDVFRYPLESYAKEGDLAVAISCSGNSPNVIAACEWARSHGLIVVAITGFDGGRLGKMADVHVNIPSDNFGLIEDLQLSVGHIAAQMLQRRVEAAQAKPLSTWNAMRIARGA